MTVRVQFQFRDEVAQRLARAAADLGVSRQSYVQHLIMEDVEEETAAEIIAQDPVGRGVQKLARAMAEAPEKKRTPPRAEGAWTLREGQAKS